jgi:hypothetical protein
VTGVGRPAPKNRRPRPAHASAIRAAGVRAGAGELAAVRDQVLVADRRAGEVGLQDLPGSGRVPGLG